MNVLVAVDLSAASEQVVAVAGRVAKATGAKVYIIHCAEPDPDFVGYDAGPEVVRDQVAAELHREHEQVQALAKQLRADEIDATALLIRGPTVETTLKEAMRLDAELIVVGSHGHGAVYNLLVGSYSAGILRKSAVPVLVVPTRG
jgi:nucleotide-binding universal stress UspA family protein